MSEIEAIQGWLKTKVADLLFVKPEEIDIREPFANYGLGSADAVGLSGELEERFGQNLSPTLFFDYPCIAAVANYLAYGAGKETQKEAELSQSEPIAIIGMGCRFPGGADSPEEFWELLRTGFDAIIDVPANRWDTKTFYSPDLDAPGKMYTRCGGFLPDLDQFDATFFGISPHEAVQMHPQQRMLLEVAWQALENAGQETSALAGSNTGVFIGLMNMQDYAQLQVQSGDTSYMDNPYFVLGNASNIAAGRLSYIFDFQGPNLTIDTACSSSLVALHLACQSLRHKECNLALVGGVSTYLLPEHVVNGCKIRMISLTGRCHTFDAEADGSTIGEGCGVVVIKRLSDALAQGDNILAVVRGSAINQDGRSNGITAPSKLAQQAAILQALANAGLEPQRVGYVEAHGSGTPLGDPIEVEALANTLGEARSAYTPEHPLVIGSVKTNIGHLAGAAGIAGLIKTVLALSHKEIPPHLNFNERNPYIRWDICPLTIPTSCIPWPKEEMPRIAGINSFGWSGTNAHILLEEGPAPSVSTPSSRAASLLLLSAKTESALEQASANLLAYLQHHAEANLADVAYTTQTARAAFAHRRALVCTSVQDAIATLERRDRSKMLTTDGEQAQETQEHQPSIAFLFPDVSEQFVDMTRPLYQQEPVFRERIAICCRILQCRYSLNLREFLYPDDDLSDGGKHNGVAGSEHKGSCATDYTTLTHCATFATSYALAQLFLSWGVLPQALLGYNLGEYVAACVAGILSLEDALLLIVQRTRSLSLPEEVEDWMARVTLHEPQIACISTITGDWMSKAQATDPAYWTKHQCQPTALAQGVALLLQQSEQVFLEMGIGQELSSFVKQHPLCDRKDLPLILSCLPTLESRPQVSPLLTALGKLWLEGVAIDWRSFSSHEQRAFVPLPTYPFERQSYWIQQQRPNRTAPSRQVSQQTTLDQVRREEFDNWFSLPGWKSSSPRAPFADPSSTQATTAWIFFLDDCEIGEALIERLRQRQEALNVIVVTPGLAFSQHGEHLYTIHPTSTDDYASLFQALRTQAWKEIRVVHLWTLTDPQQDQELLDAASFAYATRKGFSSVLPLVQALEHLSFDTCKITLVSNGIQDVLGNEVIFPAKATLLGPCLVIPFEYPDITCRCIDITLPETAGWQREALLSQLLGELTDQADEPMVALRDDRRWLPTMEHLPLPEQSAPTDSLRERGVYLITGGTGGIGLAVAEYLARTVRARVVLVSRSALPPREEWAQLRASRAKKDRLGRQLRAIQRIEELGGQVLPLQADVTDAAQMREAIRQTISAFGALHGVLHAAGLPGVGLIQLKTPEQAATVLAPKVLGTLVLEQALADLPLDFLVLFSSITSFTGGGPGQMDYAAANAFLDAYAQRNRRRHGKTIAIDWGEWQWNAWEEGLSGYSSEVQQFLKEHRQQFGISFVEGTEALGRLLASRQPRVVVSTQDVQTFTDLLKSSFATGLGHQARQGDQARPKYPRPTLASSYTPPRNELEQSIVAIWENLLGVEPVGIYDNFFELGGNSLIGITLLTHMRKILHLDHFPAHVLYEAPSVSNLAQYIGQGQDSNTLKERQERGERRRAGLAQRLETTRRRK